MQRTRTVESHFKLASKQAHNFRANKKKGAKKMSKNVYEDEDEDLGLRADRAKWQNMQGLMD